MIHYDNLIKAEKMKYYNDYETLLFARAEDKIKSVTGVLPLTFTAKAGNAADWVISGNAQGVGERTENLIDAQAYEVGKAWNTSSNADRATVTFTVKPNTTYTLKVFETVAPIVFIAVKESADATTAVAGRQLSVNESVTITTTASAYTLAIQLNKTAITLNDCQNCKITLTEGSTAPAEYIPYGYQIPLTVSQQGQPDKTVDIYIGDTPLTEGQQVSKTSTGQDIELFSGENTVDTSLYNKPEMKIEYK